MRRFVIASDRIPLKKPLKTFLIHPNESVEVEYTPDEMLDFFKRDRRMLVFASLEDAKQYASNQRKHINCGIFEQSKYDIHLEYVIHEVELEKGIDLGLYPRVYDNPRYRKVPACFVAQVLSAYDGLGRTYDLSDLAEQQKEEAVCSIQ